MREDTKREMAAQLKTLMAQKPLNKITIREITDGCGLNRQAFYYHFTDIFDLVKWTYSEEALALMAEHVNFLTWEDGVLQLLNYAEENRAALRCLFHSIQHEQLKRFFYADIHTLLETFINTIPSSQVAAKDDKAFIAHFYALAFGSLAEDWILDDAPQRKSVDEMLRLIRITVFGNLENALERSIENTL
ncbi:MAG: TetR/AcrR family transcriptional regulator C-terminal domain-containing protein [Eubacteriales bacterium]|nr:TetR/AcrR family transcriptional regulator C-terminal domain-containing protein [Eubacteriales bacterium]